jgi:hypothetical protein
MKSVLPVFIHDSKGRPERLGSCILTVLEGYHFAFTAGHVIQRAGDDPPWVAAGGQLVQLPCGQSFRSRQDEVDLGIFPLRASGLDVLRGCTFLGGDAFDETDVPAHRGFGERSYFVFGYSAARSHAKISHERRQIHQLTYHVSAQSEPPETYVREGLDPSLHVVIEFDRDTMLTGGKRAAPPMPYGCSGGGIFHLLGRERDADAKLVAILTEYRRNARIVVGTRVAIAAAYARLLCRVKPALFR